MNPPVKKGKYSMVDDESIQSCSTHLQQQQNNLKQCEYVSNRTRLRCQNFKSIDELKDFGFCNEHQGYIERIRKEGLRTKHLFDPNFNITEGFLELISFDEDETLDSRVPTDFPFIYEPLYCESRLDGDENPLRNAGIFNKKEILNEYCRAIKRCQAAIREQRLIYREKHSKIVRQGIRLAEQPNPVQIDPIKNGEKIQRLNVMRRDALRLDQRQVFKEKFARLDTDLIEKCVGKRNKWLQQIEHPIDENERIVSQLVTEMVDLIVLTKSKRGPKTMLIPSTMHLIGKQNFVSSSTNSSSSTSNSSSSTAIFYPLPNTIIDILKQFKNCYFEEYERKIKEEEEREEIERQKRLGRKIAIKMVNNNNNSSSTTTSTGAATNIGISRGSSISSDGQQQQPHQPQPPTPLKTKIQNILTSSTTLAAHQQQSSSQKQSQNNLKNKKTLIYSKINKNNVRQQQQPLNQHIHPQIKKRLVNENQIGYFSTIQLGGGQSSSFSTTTPQQQQPPKIINSVANNYLDPHGYLSSSSTTYLRPSTSTATTIYNNNGNLLNNNFNKRIIRPISIDEDINPDVFLQLTHPQLTEKYGGNNNKRGGGGGRLASVELVDEDDDDFNEDYNNNDSSTFVCARINLPWNGKRKTPFKKNTKILLFDTQQKLQQETKEKNVNKNDNNNNGYVQYVANVLSRYSSTIL